MTVEMSVARGNTQVVGGSHYKNSTRTNKVVLLGPHDRYNFGDLLFSKVLAELLITRAGYSPEDILYGGIISVNMSAFGGPSTVLSMKEIQNRSRTNGLPYDIIYTGGEALGCTFECATKMMPSPQLRETAAGEKVHGCAYLFPKRLLLPQRDKHSNHNTSKSSSTTTNNNPLSTPSNYAVLNSLGGAGVNNACKEAVNTADYVAYRDKDPLFPDSAVMTKELFSDEIDRAAEQVWKDIGAPKRYIAVQFRMVTNPSDLIEIAAALDAVSRGLNATIVMFAAGTVPNHDSFESYQKVQTVMNETAIVCQAEHVWKVIGLISKAQAVISTSLHVRIMAFLYSKPRITWSLGKPKLPKFIQLWDTNTSAPSVVTKADTWAILQKHYLASPDRSKDLTVLKYEESVNRYLESFSRISRLLRPPRVV